MKKYNFYVNKRDYGRDNAILQREVELITEEFYSLVEDYTNTLNLLNEDMPLFATVCLNELAFHVNNVKKIKNLKNKSSFLD